MEGIKFLEKDNPGNVGVFLGCGPAMSADPLEVRSKGMLFNYEDSQRLW